MINDLRDFVFCVAGSMINPQCNHNQIYTN